MLERFVGVLRGADLGAPELHLQAQALERVGVVLDDQDAVALAQARHVAVDRLGAQLGSISGSQSTNSLPWPGPFAEALDVAAVQLGDAACQRQADAEAAEGARQRLVLLREQLEGVRQELGVDAFAAGP